MPDAPRSSFFTRFVLENPWPLGLLVLAIAAVLIWLGLCDGRSDRLKAGGVFALLGLIVLAIGIITTTAGEHGRRIARQLVERAVAGDVTGAMNLFTTDAVLTIGRLDNPGSELTVIQSGLQQLASEYKVESNYVTDLDAFSESGNVARVYLACLTDAGFGYTPSRWILIIRRQPDDSWKIERITCVDINGQTPGMGIFE